MAYDIKRILKERESNYIKKTEEVLLGFFRPLKNAIQDVIYNGEDVQLVIKGLKPLTHNLDYVTITLSVAAYDIGDVIPVRDDPDSDSYQRTVEITEENFWSFADIISINFPISILETKDDDTIKEFVGEVYENDIPIPEDEGETAQTIEDLLEGKPVKKRQESEFDEFDEYEQMDEAQRVVFDLYNTSKGTSH